MRLESAKCKTADIAKQAAAVAAGQFKTYNFGLDSRHGAPLYGSLLLQLLILLVVANGSAVVAKKLLGVVFGRPLDGGTHVGPVEQSTRACGLAVRGSPACANSA